jgi:hypothetical protein
VGGWRTKCVRHPPTLAGAGGCAYALTHLHPCFQSGWFLFVNESFAGTIQGHRAPCSSCSRCLRPPSQKYMHTMLSTPSLKEKTQQTIFSTPPSPPAHPPTKSHTAPLTGCHGGVSPKAAASRFLAPAAASCCGSVSTFARTAVVQQVNTIHKKATQRSTLQQQKHVASIRAATGNPEKRHLSWNNLSDGSLATGTQ